MKKKEKIALLASILSETPEFIELKVYSRLKPDTLRKAVARDIETLGKVKSFIEGVKTGVTVDDVPIIKKVTPVRGPSPGEKLKVAMWYIKKIGHYEEAKIVLEAAGMALTRLEQK